MIQREENRYSLRGPFNLILAFLGGILLTMLLFHALKKEIHAVRNDKVDEVMQYIERYYVDTVNKNVLLEDAIKGMLQSLDPHSTYANTMENRQEAELLEGAFEGVGIQFNIMNDTIMVVATISGGPSERVGIRAGDRIVTVNDALVAGVGIESNKVMKLLRGKKNSVVKVGIMRTGFKEIYHYDIRRDVIPTYTVDVSYMIDNQVGYIKINQFGSTTPEEFDRALTRLTHSGMTKLILDLRGNPGGYLDAAILVCDELLSAGEMIVYTEGLHVPTEKIYATASGKFETGELVVLIDDFSASASEIVAGAVQDNDRGTIIGRRSFGKGLVQKQIDLSDKSTIRLTIARYHTPSGRCIQKTYSEGSDIYYQDLVRRYEHGEMNSADSIHFDQTLKYYTKIGRVVYGGGGIMPDRFVALDRDSTLTAFYQVANSSAFVEYAFNYTTQYSTQIKSQYPDAKSFVNKMNVNDVLYRDFIQFYVQKGGSKSLVINDRSKTEIKRWLKALIGRNLYQEEGYYPIINVSDNVILEALRN
ncbi:MAG: S41 family peptidase [Bacteroidales bacterium]|jgi:carboxyl-terminal processing protease|nr:S41 family peptidase [Bacteroidales bacterium]